MHGARCTGLSCVQPELRLQTTLCSPRLGRKVGAHLGQVASVPPFLRVKGKCLQLLSKIAPVTLLGRERELLKYCTCSLGGDSRGRDIFWILKDKIGGVLCPWNSWSNSFLNACGCVAEWVGTWPAKAAALALYSQRVSSF